MDQSGKAISMDQSGKAILMDQSGKAIPMNQSGKVIDCFSIEGPSKCKIDCHDNGDGTADVRYYPTAPGEYAVHVLCDKEDIPKSPFMAAVVPKKDFHPDKVICSGPGLEKNGVISNRPTEFTVDTRPAGLTKAPLDVKVMDEEYNTVDVHVKENADGTHKCFYTPKAGNK
ncbi:unnamed protein product, partial [Cyprideis torosa]